jgi:hypothetical protein
MPPEDIKEALQREPFVPFRICLTDGTRYEIRHQDLVMVGKRSLVIGLAEPSQADAFYDRYVTVALIHVTRLEPIDVVPAA